MPAHQWCSVTGQCITASSEQSHQMSCWCQQWLLLWTQMDGDSCQYSLKSSHSSSRYVNSFPCGLHSLKCFISCFYVSCINTSRTYSWATHQTSLEWNHTVLADNNFKIILTMLKTPCLYLWVTTFCATLSLMPKVFHNVFTCRMKNRIFSFWTQALKQQLMCCAL